MGISSDWRAYSYDKEFRRLGFMNKENKLRIISNERGAICSSYPAQLVIPDSSEINISSIIQFRSRGRIPVISWRGKYNQTLLRSSQPLAGRLGSVRCEADEKLLRTTMDIVRKDGRPASRMYIYDARPTLNATANKLQGGGTESTTNYSFSEVSNLPIENIHEVRSAYYKYIKTLMFVPKTSYEFRSSIESSKWFKFLYLILSGTLQIVNKLKEGYSVLCHCSDGWDRTSQLTSLSMLILDPYYRTIEGFLVLIEKEWITFGHNFRQRSGMGVKCDIDISPIVGEYCNARQHDIQKIDTNDNDSSPIFTQFIECVEIIRKQQPNVFEFNESYLVFILDSLYNCFFANFLEYPNTNVGNITNMASIVPYVLSHQSLYKNNDYREYNSELNVDLKPSQFSVWKAYYSRYEKTFKTDL